MDFYFDGFSSENYKRNCCLPPKLSCGRRIISNIFRKTFSRLINHLNIKATGGVRSHKIHISPKKQLFWIYASFLEYFDGHRRFTVLLNQFVFQDDFLSPKLKTFGLQCLKFKSRNVSESSERYNLI